MQLMGAVVICERANNIGELDGGNGARCGEEKMVFVVIDMVCCAEREIGNFGVLVCRH